MSSSTIAAVTGSVYARPVVPAAASTMTIASGPYATEESASRESAARPSSAVSRCLSPALSPAPGDIGGCSSSPVAAVMTGHTSTCPARYSVWLAGSVARNLRGAATADGSRELGRVSLFGGPPECGGLAVQGMPSNDSETVLDG